MPHKPFLVTTLSKGSHLALCLVSAISIESAKDSDTLIEIATIFDEPIDSLRVHELTDAAQEVELTDLAMSGTPRGHLAAVSQASVPPPMRIFDFDECPDTTGTNAFMKAMELPFHVV